MLPTPERYAEIQQALVDKGYAKPPADGKWNQDWSESLKRFQRDQNIEASGKLTSLSLMALGLGPKRGGANAGTSSPGPPPDTTDRGPQ